MLLCVSDYHYAQGMSDRLDPRQRIEEMRLAAKFDPFEVDKRIASANLLSDFALNSKDENWLKAAQIENRATLHIDPTNSEVLQKAILVDLELTDDTEAEIYYQQFKRIDRKSPMHELVAKAHQKRAAPSPSIPDGN